MEPIVPNIVNNGEGPNNIAGANNIAGPNNGQVDPNFVTPPATPREEMRIYTPIPNPTANIGGPVGNGAAAKNLGPAFNEIASVEAVLPSTSVSAHEEEDVLETSNQGGTCYQLEPMVFQQQLNVSINSSSNLEGFLILAPIAFGAVIFFRKWVYGPP